MNMLALRSGDDIIVIDAGLMFPEQERLGVDDSKVLVNIDRYGNTTAGTIPLAMETARQEGKLKKGSLVLLASVGAGFTVGATLLRWAY